MFLSSMFTTLIVIPSVFSEEVTSVKVFFSNNCSRNTHYIGHRCMYCHKDGWFTPTDTCLYCWDSQKEMFVLSWRWLIYTNWHVSVLLRFSERDVCIVMKMADLHQLTRVCIVEILRKRCLYCHKDGWFTPTGTCPYCWDSQKEMYVLS